MGNLQQWAEVFCKISNNGQRLQQWAENLQPWAEVGLQQWAENLQQWAEVRAENLQQ